MKDYNTITEKGKRLDYLDHEIKLMKTEKEVQINEVYEKIKHCTHMTIEAKYLSSISHTIKLVRTWENERIIINYTDSAKPLLGIDFAYEDIEEIKQLDNMYNHIIIQLKGDTEVILS